MTTETLGCLGKILTKSSSQETASIKTGKLPSGKCVCRWKDMAMGIGETFGAFSIIYSIFAQNYAITAATVTTEAILFGAHVFVHKYDTLMLVDRSIERLEEGQIKWEATANKVDNAVDQFTDTVKDLTIANTDFEDENTDFFIQTKNLQNTEEKYQKTVEAFTLQVQMLQDQDVVSKQENKRLAAILKEANGVIFKYNETTFKQAQILKQAEHVENKLGNENEKLGGNLDKLGSKIGKNVDNLEKQLKYARQLSEDTSSTLLARIELLKQEVSRLGEIEKKFENTEQEKQKVISHLENIQAEKVFEAKKLEDLEKQYEKLQEEFSLLAQKLKELEESSQKNSRKEEETIASIAHTTHDQLENFDQTLKNLQNVNQTLTTNIEKLTQEIT